jgi:hypothetical protein
MARQTYKSSQIGYLPASGEDTNKSILGESRSGNLLNSEKKQGIQIASCTLYRTCYVTYPAQFFTACSRIVENDLFKQDWRSRKKHQIFQYIVMKWTLVLLIGLFTAVVGFFNNLAVENIAGFKLLLTGELMLKQR